MSRVSKKMPSKNEEQKHANFMGGVSYDLSPIQTLMLVASSSMFGEPKYYQKEGRKERAISPLNDLMKPYVIIKDEGKTPSQVTLEAIDNALDFDFKATLEAAVKLRNEYNIRFVPQLIMVKAAMHEKRTDFDIENSGFFKKIQEQVMKRADEPAAQLACWLWLHNWSKSGIPSILKRTWKAKIESLSPYQAAKYKNAESGLINLVRICHASGKTIDELMTKGNIELKEEESTWENLRSAGVSFLDIIKTIKMPHMALLRNLRNIMEEKPSEEVVAKVCEDLKAGVKNGKQFPFRYYSAMVALSKKNKDNESLDTTSSAILEALDECIDISTAELPKLKGKTVALSDNSGSAWGAFTSEYGSMTVANIDNISSVIAAKQSDSGCVVKFGDRIKVFPVSKRNGVLSQAKAITAEMSKDVGGYTENGIWLFFKKAIEEKMWYDNIFIFSDQQAGHGGLYGEGSAYYIKDDPMDFSTRKNADSSRKFIDVMKLLEAYRSKVNPKCNFFSVQTAGYQDAVIPEHIYRGAVLYGWTGKEVLFASKLIEQWDEAEKNKKQEN